MKILFLSRLFYPHIGGVEKHVAEIANSLRQKGNNVTILTEKYNKSVKNKEIINGVKVVRFYYPHIKIVGLLKIWWHIFENRKLIQKSDVIHIHDIFIWYLPFRFLFPNKKVFTTFHGWEGKWPIPWLNIVQKQVASRLSVSTIAVGKYIEKYYGIKVNKIIYGGFEKGQKSNKKKNSVVFVGRLEKDTGVLQFLKQLDNIKYSYIVFVGDGILRKKCEKYGKVTGFTNPTPYLKKAEYAIPSGYLSYIESISFGCKINVYPNNPLKKDYWREIEEVKKFPTWDKLADQYLDLYKNS